MLAVSDADEVLAADPGAAGSADLIVACGDLPFDYLGSLANALDVPLVFVPGNHDPDLSGYRTSRAGLTLRAGIPVRAPWPDGAVNADGRVVDVAGLRVAGLWRVPPLLRWPQPVHRSRAGTTRDGAARPGQVGPPAPSRRH